MRQRSAEGYTPQEIAKQYTRDLRTVKAHLKMTDKDNLAERLRQAEPRVQTPRLSIDFHPEKYEEDQGTYGAAGKRAFFICCQVINQGDAVAANCQATIEVLKPRLPRHGRPCELHWAHDDPPKGSPYSAPIDILPGRTRRLDVVFLPLAKHLAQQWPSQPLTSSFLPSFRSEDGDLSRRYSQVGGCWIANPEALVHPEVGDQYHLAPGEWTAETTVRYGDGRRESRQFVILSPKAGGLPSMTPLAGEG